MNQVIKKIFLYNKHKIQEIKGKIFNARSSQSNKSII